MALSHIFCFTSRLPSNLTVVKSPGSPLNDRLYIFNASCHLPSCSKSIPVICRPFVFEGETLLSLFNHSLAFSFSPILSKRVTPSARTAGSVLFLSSFSLIRSSACCFFPSLARQITIHDCTWGSYGLSFTASE